MPNGTTTEHAAYHDRGAKSQVRRPHPASRVRQPGIEVMVRRVYLDYNATAPVWPEVVAAVSAALREGGNASSVHAEGRTARARIEDARASVAALVGAETDSVVFTGSGTESNNQALRMAGRRRVLVTAIEHDSVLRAHGGAARIPTLPAGTLDLAALERMLSDDGTPAVVAVMLANNETGVIQPVAEAARIAHAHGAVLHCDAVQAVGKIPVDVAALDADSYALSAHKIGGPQGVGALVVRNPDGVARFIHGGGQERGLRAGTENVAGIAGYGAAAHIAAARLDEFAALGAHRDRLEGRLGEIADDVVVIGQGAPRLPNTSKLAMPGVASQTQVIAMDLEGIAISAGSACASGRVEIPHVRAAMSVPDCLALSAVRVSMGWATTDDDLDRYVAAWAMLWRRARARAA